MSVYRDLYEKLAAHQGDGSSRLGPQVRLMKLTEEAGEVMQAYIGLVGANKRKGHYATADDVAAELCDVVVTAMVALHDWTGNPEALLKERLVALKGRMEVEGS